MTESEKKKYLNYLTIVNKMKDLESEGITLYLEGRKVTPEEMAFDCFLNEPDNYMKDYHMKHSRDSETD